MKKETEENISEDALPIADSETQKDTSLHPVPKAPVIIQKTPIFQNANRFNKSNFWNTANIRQRPWRAAWRWR